MDTTPIGLLITLAGVISIGTVRFVAVSMHREAEERRRQS